MKEFQKSGNSQGILLSEIHFQLGGGGNSHRLGYGMCHFSRVLFQLENRFLGQDFSLE